MRSFKRDNQLGDIVKWLERPLGMRKAMGSIPGDYNCFCFLDFAIIVEKLTSDHFYQRKTV